MKNYEQSKTKKVYGEESLKEILTNLLEKTFIKEIERKKNAKSK